MRGSAGEERGAPATKGRKDLILQKGPTRERTKLGRRMAKQLKGEDKGVFVKPTLLIS